MNKIKHIVVALDPSDQSNTTLDATITLAKLSGAKITGVCVLVIYPTLVTTVINYKKFLLTKTEEMLSNQKKYCEKQKIHYSSEITIGNISSQITKSAEKHKADLIIVNSKGGRKGIKEAILGSHVNSIINKFKVPVLVLK